MCRILGIISLNPVKASKFLVEPECSLLAQAEKGRQGDGWGIAYYDKGSLRVIKSARPVYEEKEKFVRVSENIVSNLIIAHVRKASNPRNLPYEKLISVINSQPFFYNNFVFVHNGEIRALEIEEELGEYKKLIQGVNDSEIYFAYLYKELEDHGNVVEALKRFEKRLWDIYFNKKMSRKPFSALNAIFSDGSTLYAYNRYVIKGKKSLCYGDSERYQMVYKYTGDTLIVASEKLDREGWKPLNNNELLIAELTETSVKFKIRRMPYDITGIFTPFTHPKI